MVVKVVQVGGWLWAGGSLVGWWPGWLVAWWWPGGRVVVGGWAVLGLVGWGLVG